MSQSFQHDFMELRNIVSGEVQLDEITKILYSTDASAYRERPLGVVFPKNAKEVKDVVTFAAKHKVPLIPRAAGTSLAGQVVGSGLVVDISRYMTKILEVNKEEKWIRIEPGVNLDEMNAHLKGFGLFFGPETSTSNRCLLGGMLGNNGCGLHSLAYGSTRDHTLEVKAVLSDGSEAHFKSLTTKEFEDKCKGDSLESRIYKTTYDLLSNKENQEEIIKEYPAKSLHRRNTGYAIDLLLDAEQFTPNGEVFNFCKLLAGAEGTLAFTTEIKLNCVPLPPKEKAVVAIHCATLMDAMYGNLICLKYKPTAIELMDDIIMNCTKNNIEQQKNRFFIEGDPKALLIVELVSDDKNEIITKAEAMEKEMRAAGYGYSFPMIWGDQIKNVWNLRKAGLGLLSNIPGDAKPVSVIEDTAVDPTVLPDYIADFQKLLDKYQLTSVFHAHIATGELHLRPLLDLKLEKDVELFHTIALEVAKLVKKYKGSLSGEHGDGRLRGEFIPLMIGEKNYKLIKQIKATWDPDFIFNPNKIVDTPPMNKQLRYVPGNPTREVETIFDFSREGGIMRAAENCNGSADCRKSHIIGGTMCPSFMATRNEQHVTRARANILREFLTNSTKANPFDHKEIYQVMDLCLSCKACKAECPSNIDVAKLKAEFLQHYYDANGVPLRAQMIAYITSINYLGAAMPGIYNFFTGNSFFSGMIKGMIGFAKKRSIPSLYKKTLNSWFKSKTEVSKTYPNGKVYLFNDEFTNYNDTEIGIKAIQLLNGLGYEVVIPKHEVSARTFLSKGLLRKARTKAIANILHLKDLVSSNTPLVGIEPSAILSFRDEYPELVGKQYVEEAKKLAKNVMMIDEFLAKEVAAGKIKKEQFTTEKREIKLHGHCQQKAIASTNPTKTILSLPENYTVSEIPSGCCGMAGSFGYEKEHYELSMQVGELVLFPAVRQLSAEVLVAAPGTSCRHQIHDGTGKKAFHPVEILYDAMKK